jgi:NADH-quinone oxidoreductase subunit C
VSPEELEKTLTSHPAVASPVHFRGELTVTVKGEDLVSLAAHLKDEPALAFDFLSDLTGVEYADRFEVVYHLYSIPHSHRLRVKVRLERDNPTAPSVTSVWPTADWHEREAYDLLGITFSGHPNLVRILMPDDFEGHPLRKDYPLKGRGK